MGRTLAEALIAAHTTDPVEPGSICRVRVDFAFANDITGAPAIAEFARMGAERVFDPGRCAIVPDHFTPNKDIASARQVQAARNFAREQGMLFWEVGRAGVEHAFLPEKGLILPGEVILGADSHTCTGGALGAFATGVGSTDLAAAWALGETWFRVPPTIRVLVEGEASPWVTGKDLVLTLIGMIGVEGARYAALQFEGSAIDALPMDDRFTVANMAVEAGAKAGLFVPDGKTLGYANKRAARPFEPVFPDPDAVYGQTIRMDASGLEPVVALPHLPSNVKPARECGHLDLDQVFIGSCTNGRLRDLELAAAVLRGRTVHERVRLVVIPATAEVFAEALKRGYIETFLEAGAAISTASCGPCLGGHYGILAPGERCLSTSNRNFVGRMGHSASELVLSSPLVAAASAVTGRVTDPREIMAGCELPGGGESE